MIDRTPPNDPLASEGVLRMMIHFLEMLSEELSSRGSNDFSIKEFMASHGDAVDFVRGAEAANGTPDEFDPNRDPFTYMPDWWVASYLAQLLEHLVDSSIPLRPHEVELRQLVTDLTEERDRWVRRMLKLESRIARILTIARGRADDE